MSQRLKIAPKVRPELDRDFLPASLWCRAYREAVQSATESMEVVLRVYRGEKCAAEHVTPIFPHLGDGGRLNEQHIERLAKFLLWKAGGDRITVRGSKPVEAFLPQLFAAKGSRSFDSEFFSKVYKKPFRALVAEPGKPAGPPVVASRFGGHWKGCRVGFDLGASDRKCAAVVDGKVVHTEEVRWDPAKQKDPKWHVKEIQDSIRRAAAKLPRVDAIGGCGAGVYVDGEVRASSLFRGVPEKSFERSVHGIFKEVLKPWKDARFAVLNDGGAAALAGAAALDSRPVLGLALGSSLAAGYVDAQGRVSGGLDELAFAPIDYRENAPLDEWSGDRGCGAAYLSQQAVVRLLPAARIMIAESLPEADKLSCVQDLMRAGRPQAARLFRTIGAYLGYAAAHYADFYPLGRIIVFGRVLSGPGGDAILDEARRVIKEEFPDLEGQLQIEVLDERARRHGQAIAAASLPPDADG